MSPRGALRLETLGFERVFDYVPGKADWLAHGLPGEGQNAGRRTAGDIARRDVVTCHLNDDVDEVRRAIAGSPYGFGLVLGADDVLLGRVRATSRGSSVELSMEPGPSTIRPDTSVEHVAHTMVERDLKTTLVTTPEGRLVGVVRRADAEGISGGKE